MRKTYRLSSRSQQSSEHALRGPAARSSTGHASSAAAFALSRFPTRWRDRKSTRLNSSHGYISYAVFCLKKKKKDTTYYEAREVTIRLVEDLVCHNTLHAD